MPEQAPDHEAREFAAAFRGFLDWVHSTATRDDNEVSTLARDFLGPDGVHHSVVTRDLPPSPTPRPGNACWRFTGRTCRWR